jgi:hypothetical protein
LADHHRVLVTHLGYQVMQQGGSAGFSANEIGPFLMGFSLGLNPLSGFVFSWRANHRRGGQGSAHVCVLFKLVCVIFEHNFQKVKRENHADLH